MGTKAKKGDFRETERESGRGGCKDTEEETGKQQREKTRANIKSTEGNTEPPLLQFTLFIVKVLTVFKDGNHTNFLLSQ